MKHIYICNHCGEKDRKLLMRKSRSGNIQYYCCRKCNTAYMRRYLGTKEGKEKVYSAVYKSIKRYPERQSARLSLWWAVKRGKIKKPSFCEDCGKEGRVEGHHDDYSKPLSVVWVCRSCHRIRDKSMVRCSSGKFPRRSRRS